MIERVQTWLSQSALPLWLKNGVDWDNGGFVESLSQTGAPLDLPRRAMVQARQIYSFQVGIQLNLCDTAQARRAIELGAKSLLTEFSASSGAFIHSIGTDRQPANSTADLYTQAFALFGLAVVYGTTPRMDVKMRAKELLHYLSRERRLDNGGYAELTADGPSLQSNPHMHLFEAAIEWMSVDSDPEWKALADELLELALKKFIDPATGALAEMFSENGLPLLDEGRFYYEPGHLYEWSWLMGRYETLTGRPLMATRLRLFELAERSGLDRSTKMVLDQIWSDFTPKLRSSRFWPQCERIKVAAQLAREATSRETAAAFGGAADEALKALFEFLNHPMEGLWADTREASGAFKNQPAKASSFYHIIGAMSEYVLWKRSRDRR